MPIYNTEQRQGSVEIHLSYGKIVFLHLVSLLSKFAPIDDSDWLSAVLLVAIDGGVAAQGIHHRRTSKLLFTFIDCNSLFRRSRAICTYVGSISIPMLFLPARAAASIVVPVPTNGSSTVSFAKLNIRMSLSASSSGNGAG